MGAEVDISVAIRNDEVAAFTAKMFSSGFRIPSVFCLLLMVFLGSHIFLLINTKHSTRFIAEAVQSLAHEGARQFFVSPVGTFEAQHAHDLCPVPVEPGTGKVWRSPAYIVLLGPSIHTAKHSMGCGGSGVPVNRIKIQTETLPAFEVLKDRPGLRPAPYLASRGLTWIQHYAKPGLADGDLKDHLRQSYRLVASTLSKKKQQQLRLALE